jgi:DNA-binding CsgD family transcriptional regulator
MRTGAYHKTRNVSQLTEREAQILALRKEKKTYKEIAEILSITVRTVDGALRRAYEKELAK